MAIFKYIRTDSNPNVVAYTNDVADEAAAIADVASRSETYDVPYGFVDVTEQINGGDISVEAVDVSLANTDLTGVISGSGNVQEELKRLDNTGIGSAPRTFTGSFFCSYGSLGNQDQWYGGRQAVEMVGDRGQANGRYTFQLPDPTELGLMFDDMASRNIAQIYTLTVSYQGGSSSFINRNSMTITAPSVSAGFDRNEIPTTIAQGSSVTFRIERIGGVLTTWERLSVEQAADPVATFGEVVLQNTGWNNANNSFLPSGDMVQKGFAFPVIGSNPNDGTLRQGLLDSGVSDRSIYDGDYVVWTADSFTAWTNSDDWFVLSRNDLQRMSREESNFLSQVSEIDNRVEIAPINALGSEGVVWVSDNPLAEAPFINPSTDTNNPRTGDDYAYIGGRENRDGSGLSFQFNQNRFNSYLTVGITPSFIAAHPESDIRIRVRDTDRNIIDDFNLATDFVFTDNATFTNDTYRHYKRDTSFNYPFLATIEVVLTQVQRHFRINPNTVDTTQNIPAGSLQENQLSNIVVEKLNRALPPVNTDFSSIQDRLSPYKNIDNSTVEQDARYFSTSATGEYPSSLSDFTQVNSANPRFTATDAVLFVAVPEPGTYTLMNVTADTVTPLIDGQTNVEVVQGFTSNGTTYFVYRIDGISNNDVVEVFRFTQHQVVAWADDIRNLEDDVERIDAELSHALLNLSDEVVHVFEHDVTVSEETSVTTSPTDYNRQLAGASNQTQTVFYETNPNTPSGGLIASKPISDTTGSRARRKLIYFPEGIDYQNQAYLTAFDTSTGRDLITYREGEFYVNTRVNGTPASTSTNTIYPAPPTRVSGSGIWQTIPALTFQNGVPVPEADELFFTRNIPTTSTTLTIDYRGHANGNVFGASNTTLNGVGGSSDVFATFTLNDGSEQLDVEVRYEASTRRIRVSETARVFSGLPTINDVQVILSFEETRTTPATSGYNLDVLLEHEHTGAQVFSIKPSSSGSLIIVGDRQEIDTNRPYTTLFGGSENGWLIATDANATFLDYQDFEPIDRTITDLENHATLPQFGLFTNNYTDETTLNFGTEVKVQSLNIGNIPTSADGLSAGDVWNDSGTLKIV